MKKWYFIDMTRGDMHETALNAETREEAIIEGLEEYDRLYGLFTENDDTDCWVECKDEHGDDDYIGLIEAEDSYTITYLDTEKYRDFDDDETPDIETVRSMHDYFGYSLQDAMAPSYSILDENGDEAGLVSVLALYDAWTWTLRKTYHQSFESFLDDVDYFGTTALGTHAADHFRNAGWLLPVPVLE